MTMHTAICPAGADDALLSALRLAIELGDVLADLPLPVARAVVRGLAAALDDVRTAMGREVGLSGAVPLHVPDFLKDRHDHRRDLWRAWQALGDADRGAFLAWANRRAA